MAGESVLDGVRWLLVAVFALSAVEKGASLWTRSASWHPVMLVSPARRRHARWLMGAALAADLATIALLAAAPLAGAVATAALVATYTGVAFPVHGRPGQSCRCFWELLDTTTRTSFLVRNGVLVALAAAVAAWAPHGTGVAAVGYGAAFAVVLIAAVAVVDALVRRGTAIRPRGGPERAGSERAFRIGDAAYGAPQERR